MLLTQEVQPPEGESGDTEQQLGQEGKTLQRVRGRGRNSEGPWGGRWGGGGGQALLFGLAVWSSSLPCKYACMCPWSGKPVHTCRRQEKAVSLLVCKAAESLRGGRGQAEMPFSEEKNWGQRRWSNREGTKRRGREAGSRTGGWVARGAPCHSKLSAMRCCLHSSVFTDNVVCRHQPCL